MDSKEQKLSSEKVPEKVPGRIRKSWLPLTAVAAAFSSFVAASCETRPEPKDAGKTSGSLSGAPSSASAVSMTEPAEELKRKYSLAAVLGGKGSAHRFRHSLLDIAVDAQDAIYSLGDDEIRIFSPDGMFLRGWVVDPETVCLEAGPDGRIYAGASGRVDIYASNGKLTGSIAVAGARTPAAVSAVKVFGEDILIADANARLIYRYNANGNRIGVIGDGNKTGSFMLPNKWLDFDIGPNGILYAGDTGRHRVTGWLADGSQTGVFGKFGMQDPADFVGCCNPVNIAVAPDGNIVTAEKMIARVKVYSPGGELRAYIGPENFHPKCRNIHLEVDSGGRILAADPLQREIKIFMPSAGI